jgi:hypothetical protein
MVFLQIIEFILYVVLYVNRKKIRNADSPSLAEIFGSRKQQKISTN